jgi:hypothetical protein
MNEVEEIIAREAIRELKSRYFRSTDTHDFELFGSLFTKDAVFESGEFGESKTATMTGRDEIVAATIAASAGMIKIHHGHNCEISFHSPERASGIWSAEYRFFDGTSRSQKCHSFVYYYEDYVKDKGQWLISRVRLLHVHSLV